MSEPTFKPEDVERLEFRRPRASRRAPRRSKDWLQWQIAGGVFLGLALAFTVHRIVDYYQTKAAIDAINAQTAELAKPDADPFGWRAQRVQEQREEAARRALKPGERCINGQRFRRVQNGWEQIQRPC